MNNGNDPRLEAYKKQIGWAQLKEPGSPQSGVATVWPAVEKAPAFSSGGWRLIDDQTAFLEGVVQREWVLRQRRETVAVRIAVSSDGRASARQHFLRSVSSTTMMTIPYKKSLAPIGALSVEAIGADGGAVIWLYRNVCFQVRADDSAVDVRALAEWLQGYAVKGLVDDLVVRLPQLERIEVSEKVVTVGMAFAAKLWLQANGSMSADHLFSFDNDRAKLDLLEEKENSVRYRALSSGATQIVVRVADKGTLLAAGVSANVMIQ